MTSIKTVVAATVSEAADLIAARKEAAASVGHQYGAFVKYGEALNSFFGTTPVYDGKYWWEVTGNDKGPVFAPIHKEREAFYSELRATGRAANPSVYGARAREAGEKAFKATQTPAKGAAEDGADTAAGAGSKARPIHGRYVEELSKLYKIRFDEKYSSEMTDAIRNAHKSVEAALIALGVDVNTLVK